MAEKVSFSSSSYSPIPGKFEGDTPPFAQIIGFGLALVYLNKINRERGFAYEQPLFKYATAKLTAIDKLIIYGTSENKISIISFQIIGKDMTKLEKCLSDKFNIAVR